VKGALVDHLKELVIVAAIAVDADDHRPRRIERLFSAAPISSAVLNPMYDIPILLFLRTMPYGDVMMVLCCPRCRGHFAKAFSDFDH
jgi:hypothetical protein